MHDTDILTPGLNCLVCSRKLLAPFTGDLVRRSTVNLIKILKAFHNMLGLGTPELVFLDEPTGSVNNDKKVDILAIAEDFFSKISADPVHGLGRL